MKALSLLQPWATLMALGHKLHETRSWNTAYRGEVAIHASKGLPKGDDLKWGRDLCVMFDLGPIEDLPRGAVVAIGEIVSTHSTDCVSGLSDLDAICGNYSEGRFAWRVPCRPLPHPLPAKGSLGLWEWARPTYRLVGVDADFIHFATPSTTRPEVEHNLAISRDTGEVTCTCEDASCRKKVGSILDLSLQGCKHIDGLMAQMPWLQEEA